MLFAKNELSNIRYCTMSKIKRKTCPYWSLQNDFSYTFNAMLRGAPVFFGASLLSFLLAGFRCLYDFFAEVFISYVEQVNTCHYAILNLGFLSRSYEIITNIGVFRLKGGHRGERFYSE